MLNQSKAKTKGLNSHCSFHGGFISTPRPGVPTTVAYRNSIDIWEKPNRKSSFPLTNLVFDGYITTNLHPVWLWWMLHFTEHTRQKLLIQNPKRKTFHIRLKLLKLKDSKQVCKGFKAKVKMKLLILWWGKFGVQGAVTDNVWPSGHLPVSGLKAVSSSELLGPLLSKVVDYVTTLLSIQSNVLHRCWNLTDHRRSSLL